MDQQQQESVKAGDLMKVQMVRPGTDGPLVAALEAGKTGPIVFAPEGRPVRPGIPVTFFLGDPDDGEEELASARVAAVPREGEYVVLVSDDGQTQREYVVRAVRCWVCDEATCSAGLKVEPAVGVYVVAI